MMFRGPFKHEKGSSLAMMRELEQMQQTVTNMTNVVVEFTAFKNCWGANPTALLLSSFLLKQFRACNGQFFAHGKMCCTS